MPRVEVREIGSISVSIYWYLIPHGIFFVELKEIDGLALETNILCMLIPWTRDTTDFF